MLPVELHHHQQVHTHAVQQVDFLIDGQNPVGQRIPVGELPGMIGEGVDDTAELLPGASLQQTADHLLVTDVQSVEGADGHSAGDRLHLFLQFS